MHREILAGLRGFTENAAFVGGAVMTWIADPLGSNGSPGQWWYPAMVFLFFFVVSSAFTLTIVTRDKADSARQAGDDAKRQLALLELTNAVRALAAPAGVAGPTAPLANPIVAGPAAVPPQQPD